MSSISPISNLLTKVIEIHSHCASRKGWIVIGYSRRLLKFTSQSRQSFKISNAFFWIHLFKDANISKKLMENYRFL